MSGLSLQFQPVAATAILGGLVPSRVAHRPGWFTEIPLALQAWRELRRIRMATCPWSGCRHYTSVFSILPNGRIGEPIVGWAGSIEHGPTELWWDIAPWCWMTTRFIVSTSGENQTDNVPSAWNNGNNTIEVIGGGAGARNATSSFNNYGAGGGAYAKSANVSLTPSGTATFYIGPAALGGAATSTPGVDNPGEDGAWNFYNGTYYGDASVWAAGGTSAEGAGGTDGGGSEAVYPGGNGSIISGGGGAGGPNGAGASSVVSSTAFTVSDGGSGGSGGGGNGGGSDGVVNVRKDGGNGGDNSGATGHGSGATSGANAVAGFDGGGGGGGYGSTTVYRDAAAGGVGTEWDASHGSGGGGGAGAFDGRGSTTSRSNGGNGGNYGGGGGTGGASYVPSFATWRSGGSGGNGGQGIIVMVYVPVTFAGFNRAPRMTYLRR